MILDCLRRSGLLPREGEAITKREVAMRVSHVASLVIALAGCVLIGLGAAQLVHPAIGVTLFLFSLVTCTGTACCLRPGY